MGTKTFQTLTKQMKSCFLLVEETRAAGATWNLVFYWSEKRAPRVPQAFLLENVFADRARATFHAFQGWADPSERATGHSLQHGNFKHVNQELHFKDFEKTRKRENEDSKQLSEMNSFPAAADTFVFFVTCENNVNYSFPAEREGFWKTNTEKHRKPCKREWT